MGWGKVFAFHRAVKLLGWLLSHATSEFIPGEQSRPQHKRSPGGSEGPSPDKNPYLTIGRCGQAANQTLVVSTTAVHQSVRGCFWTAA